MPDSTLTAANSLQDSIDHIGAIGRVPDKLFATTWNPNEPGAGGPYQGIWYILSSIIENKDAQAVALVRAIAGQLDALGEDSPFDRSRLDDLISRLDAITTPEQPAMLAQPNVGAITYEAKSIPDAKTRSIAAVRAPEQRGLMDFGAPPEVADLSDGMSVEALQRMFERELDRIIARAQGGFEEFIVRFLPASNLTAEAMDWISDAINARGTGIPINVENQIYERNRTRIDREFARASEAAITAWAHKGHMLPPGSLVGQVAQLRRDQADQLATSSREVMIFVAEKHIENARFAIEQLMSTRRDAMNQAVNYMQALLGSPQNVGPWLTAILENRFKGAALNNDIFKTRASVATDVLRTQVDADVGVFKALTDTEIQSVKVDNDAQFEGVRTAIEQEKLRSGIALDTYKTRATVEADIYKTTQDAMMRFYETASRVAGIKADVIGRTAETAMKIEELAFGREAQLARLKVDSAMELLRTIATQVAAAINNMQLSANSSVNTSVSMGGDDE